MKNLKVEFDTLFEQTLWKSHHKYQINTHKSEQISDNHAIYHNDERSYCFKSPVIKIHTLKNPTFLFVKCLTIRIKNENIISEYNLLASSLHETKIYWIFQLNEHSREICRSSVGNFQMISLGTLH